MLASNLGLLSAALRDAARESDDGRLTVLRCEHLATVLHDLAGLAAQLEAGTVPEAARLRPSALPPGVVSIVSGGRRVGKSEAQRRLHVVRPTGGEHDPAA